MGMDSKEDFDLRPLTPADQPFLWEMLYQAIYVPAGLRRPPRKVLQEPELARYVHDWGRHGDMGFAAVDAETGQPAGAAWLRLLSGANRGYGYVDDRTPELSIALLPEYRGRGIGTALMRRLLEAARQCFPGVSLSVARGSCAHALYRRLGFDIVSEGDTGLTMYKAFSKHAG
jgi:GNAT superfamily N-acetyltransferase